MLCTRYLLKSLQSNIKSTYSWLCAACKGHWTCSVLNVRWATGILKRTIKKLLPSHVVFTDLQTARHFCKMITKMLIATAIKDQHDKMSVQRNQCICGCKKWAKKHKNAQGNKAKRFDTLSTTLPYATLRSFENPPYKKHNTIRSAYEKGKHSFTLVSSPKSIVSSATKKANKQN